MAVRLLLLNGRADEGWLVLLPNHPYWNHCKSNHKQSPVLHWSTLLHRLYRIFALSERKWEKLRESVIPLMVKCAFNAGYS